MSAQLKSFPVRPLVRAVQGALILLATAPHAVFADDADVTALTTPTNTIQVGVGDNSKKSAKFGEYNGLYNSDADFIGSVNLFGGDAYGQGSGTLRSGLKATDLGNTSRNIDVWLINQGSWRLGANFDQLSHRYGTFQSPEVGSVGGASFYIPQQFGVIQTSSVTNNAAYGTQALTATQLGMFNTYDVHSDRNTLTLSGGLDFSDQWNMRLSWGHVKQDGAKLISSATDTNNIGGVSIASSKYSPVHTNGTAATGPQGEAIQMLMNPTDFVTDNLNAAFNYVGEKGYATINLLLSNFEDKNSEVSFSNPYTNVKLNSGAYVTTGTLLTGAFPTDALSTPPSNLFEQISLTGGYDLRPKTHVVGNLSIGDGSQNMAYPNQAWDMWAYSATPWNSATPGALPQKSLNGHVEIHHFDLHVTDRSVDKLTLGGNFVINERLNTTDSNTYNWYTPSSESATAVNTPLSLRRIQEALTADYRLASAQTLHLGYEHEKYERWCENAVANSTSGPAPSGYAATTLYNQSGSCVQVPSDEENRESASYKLGVTEDIRLNAAVAYDSRKSQVLSSFYNPIQAESGGQGYENAGYVAFYQASRDEKSAKGGLDWQVLKQLDLNGKVRLVADEYPDSTLGVQHSKTAGADLDATLNLGESTSITGFATWQHSSRELLSAAGRNALYDIYSPAVPAAGEGSALTGTWLNFLVDDATTTGITLRQTGLLGNKLSVKADFVHSLDNTSYKTGLNYASSSCTTETNGGFNCGAVPSIRSEMSAVKLSGTYQLNKKSTVTLGYIYQKLASTDPYYNYYQYGTNGTSTMPTNQQSPSYTQNRFYAVYGYSFQ